MGGAPPLSLDFAPGEGNLANFLANFASRILFLTAGQKSLAKNASRPRTLVFNFGVVEDGGARGPI